MTLSLRERLLEVADRHLAENGAAALSLRAVARDLGVVPSALYRHVQGRDGLLTLLIVEAYSDLGRAVHRAEEARSREDLFGRWQALTLAMRSWAVSHAHQWGLLYGTPVTGYAAPPEETVAPGTEVMSLLVTLIGDIERLRLRGDLPAATSVEPAGTDPSGGLFGPDLMRDFDLPTPPEAEISAETVADGLMLWDLVVGSISSEVFGHKGPDFSDPEAYFAHIVRRGARFLGILPDPAVP